MARKTQKENRLKMFTFMQELDPERWNWTPEEKQALSQGAGAAAEAILAKIAEEGLEPGELSPAEQATLSQGARIAGEVMLAKLEEAGLKPTDFYVIVHDKDKADGSGLAADDGSGLKRPHFHGVARYETDPPNAQTLTNIAKAMGLEKQFVEKPKSGRYSYSNSLAYLIHAKNPDKHQYAPEEVATLIGKDYMEHYAENFEEWERGAAQVKKKKATGNDVAYYIQKVLMGKLSVNDMLDGDDELYLMYFENKRGFDQAEATFGRRQAVRAEKALNRGDFHTSVFYVTGPPGNGKTRWVATHLIPGIIDAVSEQGQQWRIYPAAPTNPMDDWHGHEIVLLDDLRAQSMTATDWLRLLDPYQAANLSARYENKMGVAPRIILINANQSPQEFFQFVRAAGDEAMDQFIRRLAMIWEVVEYDGDSDNGAITVQEVGKTRGYIWVRGEGTVHEKKVAMHYGVVTEWPQLTPGEAAMLGLASVASACSDIELMPQDETQKQQVRAKGRQQKRAIKPGELGKQLALEPPEPHEKFEPEPRMGATTSSGFFDPTARYVPDPDIRFTDEPEPQDALL